MFLLEGEWSVNSIEFVSESKTIKISVSNLIGLDKELVVLGITRVFFEMDLIENAFSDFLKINPKDKYNYYRYYCFKILNLENHSFSDHEIICYLDKRGCDVIAFLCSQVEVF